MKTEEFDMDIRKPHLHGAVFDMDGLLIDSERAMHACWQAAGREYGYMLPDELLNSTLGVNSATSSAIIKSAFPPEFPFESITARRRELFTERLSAGKVPVKPGVFALLSFFREAGIPCAVASSTARVNALRNLDTLGLTEYFRAMVFGDEVSVSKPAPDIFLRAAELIGSVPGETMVFEDSRNGIKAAKNAGMIGVLVPDLIPPDEGMLADACFCIKSLEEAPSLIKNRFSC